MSKTLQKDISFSYKAQMVQIKMNFYLNVPTAYSLISPSNVMDENKINNNYCMPHTYISNRKRW